MKFWSKAVALALVASSALMMPTGVVGADVASGAPDLQVSHMLPPEVIDIADIPVYEPTEEMRDDDDEEQPSDYTPFTSEELAQYQRDYESYDDEDLYLDERDVDEEEDDEDAEADYEPDADEDEDADELDDNDDQMPVDEDFDADEEEEFFGEEDDDLDDPEDEDGEDMIDERDDDDVDDDEDAVDIDTFPVASLEMDDYGGEPDADAADEDAEDDATFVPHMSRAQRKARSRANRAKRQARRRANRAKRRRNAVVRIRQRQDRRRAAGLRVSPLTPEQIVARRHKRRIRNAASRTKRRLRNHRRRRNKLGKKVHRKVRNAIQRARQRGRCPPGRVRRVFKEKHLKCRVTKNSPDCLARRRRINNRRRSNQRIAAVRRNQRQLSRVHNRVANALARNAGGPRRLLGINSAHCRPRACQRRRAVMGAVNRGLGRPVALSRAGGGVCALKGSSTCIRKNNNLRRRKIQKHRNGIRHLRKIKNRRNLLQCVPTRATQRRNRHNRRHNGNFPRSNFPRPRYDPRTGRPMYGPQQPGFRPVVPVPVGFPTTIDQATGRPIATIPVSDLDAQNRDDLDDDTAANGTPLAQTGTTDPLLAQQTNDDLRQQQTGGKKKKSNHTTMIIVIAAVVGLFLVGGIVYALTRQSKQQDQMSTMMMNPMMF